MTSNLQTKPASVALVADRRQQTAPLANKDFERLRGSLNTREVIPEERFESSPTMHDGQETSEVMINKYEPDPNDPDFDIGLPDPKVRSDRAIPKKQTRKKKNLKKTDAKKANQPTDDESSNQGGPGNDLIGRLFSQ